MTRTRLLSCLLFCLAVAAAAQQSAMEAANQLLNDSKWPEAAAAYEAIVAQAPANGAAWTNLGEARLQQKNLAGAKQAFERAMALKFRPYVNQVNLARVAALEGDRAQVFAIFGELVKSGNGARMRPLIAGSTEFQAFANDATYVKFLKEEMLPCRSAEYRQFDFWVGDWDVQGPAGNPAGKNLVTLEQEGCLIIEHWTSSEGIQTGTSFNYYDVRDKKWHQLYIDNSGNAGAFPAMAGELKDGKMILYTFAKDGQQSRWTWYELSPGRVRQMAEQTGDSGKTWNVTWDSVYVKKGAKPGN